MSASIIVGIIFAGIIIVAFKKARNDVKSNKCAGCSGCSSSKRCNI